MKIILFQPEIPQNTGNIARTCSVTGAGLILVRPLGFSTCSRQLKRSGLDYWKDVEVSEIDNLEAFLETTDLPFYFFSSKAKTSYHIPAYEPNALLIFGSETSGLPDFFHQKYPEKFLTIPMQAGKRCLNLSNAAAVVLFEALRQQEFNFV